MSRTSASKPIAFISYSIKDKKYGAAVREALNALNVESFLAHNDLRVSDKWEKKILKEVGRCNVFVPLLSKNFLKSEWCSQETGIIVKRRGVTIFPLLLDGTMPFGFIRHVQGQRVTLEEIDEKLFLRPLAEKFPRYILPQWIERLKKASSFRGAEVLVAPLRPYFRELNIKEANRFAELCASNNQIWQAYQCHDEYLPEFLKIQGKHLKPAIRKRLKHRVEK
jgi:hypothetical protein